MSATVFRATTSELLISETASVSKGSSRSYLSDLTMKVPDELVRPVFVKHMKSNRIGTLIGYKFAIQKLGWSCLVNPSGTESLASYLV